MICHRCVGDTYLRKEIAKCGVKDTCSYCGRIARTYTVEEMADRIEEVFEQHYTRTSGQPDSMQSAMLADRESDYSWEREGEPAADAIGNAAEIPDEAARDIQQILADRHYDHDSAACGEETEFGDEVHYDQKAQSDDNWQDDWFAFRRSLTTETRFFNQQATDHLASIFSDLDTLKTRKGRPLIIHAGPGTPLVELHRARVFHNEHDIEPGLARPDLNLGPPPSHLANAGRMNARGISVFYDATDPKVALAEVRPPVGSFVVVARFEIVKPLQLLDLTALSAVHIEGSIFDPDFAGRLAKAKFLRSLTERISRPVMPNDEALEYLPTQAVADFLASRSNVPLDGIIFPSVQTGAGLNVVLFHKAARVEPMFIPSDAEIDVSLGHFNDEGWDRDYMVFEKVPPTPPPQRPPESSDFDFPIVPTFPRVKDASNEDPRTPALRVLSNSLHVHFVRAVAIQSERHSVPRHRSEKRGRPDF